MNVSAQLRAVKLQRRLNRSLVGVAIAAHPCRGRALHEIHALGVLVLVDYSILQRQVVINESSYGPVIRFWIELEQFARCRVEAATGNDVALKRRTHAGRT